MIRKAEIKRQTGETRIELKLSIDGSGKYNISTGCGFLDHMLELFVRHSRIDMELSCQGDTHVDYHHTAEDIAIVLGGAIGEALGEKRGVKRYGSIILPMDEALVLAAVDISGRGMLVWDLPVPSQKIGDFDSELLKEFFIALARNSGITIHIKKISGENSHHIAEAAFKAAARAMAEAMSIDEKYSGEIPSTKGTLS